MRKIMTHVVAGYPNQEECLQLIVGMSKLGVSAIEVQIPFSDPSADGPTIMHANDVALENKITCKKSFDLIENARKSGVLLPVYVMTYANKVFHFGVNDFCIAAKHAGVSGLIIPDIPEDSEEYESLVASCKQQGLDVVPVVSPGMDKNRLQRYLSNKPSLVYATSTKGVTGLQLVLQEDVKQLIDEIKSLCGCTIALGFGLRTSEDVALVLEIVDVAVVGSEVVRKLDAGGVEEALQFVKSLIKS